MANRNFKVSVHVCTHNPRWDFLSRTIQGLKNQTLPREDWEIILVDNASNDEVASRVDLNWHPNARCLIEKKLGKTNALKKAIIHSQGDILVTVDDDTVLKSDYLEQAIKLMCDSPFIGVWGGEIRPEFQVPLPNWAKEHIWRLTIATVKRDVWSNLRDGFETKPAGAGMCFRRVVANQYLKQLNDDSKSIILDRSGANITGYGDMDICQCAIDLGLGTGLTSKLSLTHLIPSSRLKIDYFIRHAEGDAESLVLYSAIRGLSIPAKHHSPLVEQIKLLILKILGKITLEHYLIMKAHYRGINKGYNKLKKSVFK